MKIKMNGSELNKVDIEFLSLVKRGANRSPFKVVKSEAGEKTGLIGAVSRFFSMSDPNPAVVAVFVEKSALEKALPNLADAGFELSKHQVQDDCVVFKQTGFEDAETVIMLKSQADIGFAVANVSKHADLFSGNLLFDPSVATTGFYPGLNAAMGALQATVGDLIAKEAEFDTDEFFKSYETYAKQVVKVLPAKLWKFESLQRGFGGGTTDATVDGVAVVKTPSDVAKAAKVLADDLLKQFSKDGAGASKEGIKADAKNATGTSSSKENGNSSTSTSEMAGSKDDSQDDEKSRQAKKDETGDGKMAKADDKSSTTSTTSSEEDLAKAAAAAAKTGVKKGIRPIVFKNADGTEYHQAIDQKTGLIVKYTPGAKIPDDHTTMTEEWEQHGSNGDFGNENGQGKGKAADPDTKADNELNHTGAGGMKKMEEVLTSLATLPGLVGSLTATIEKQAGEIKANSEALKKQGERLEAVEKTAKEAVKKAESTVVHVGTVHDSAYDNLGGPRRTAVTSVRSREQVAKAEFTEDLWRGTLGVIESHIPEGIEEV